MTPLTGSPRHQTRRSFVRTAALTLGLSPFIPWKTQGPSAPFSPALPDDEKLGIAFVGMGNYATNQLASALAQATKCKLSIGYAANRQRLYAAAHQGWFELRPAYGYSGIQGATSGGPMSFPQIIQQAVQMDDFADCILNDRTSTVDGYEGLRDMRVIEGIYQSINTGRPVSLS